MQSGTHRFAPAILRPLRESLDSLEAGSIAGPVRPARASLKTRDQKFMTDIALFPIPNCVVFPGTVFPLHVFEPRYRSLVKHCLEHEMLLGICHTQKVLHESKAGQSVEEALRSNQATYKPKEIFSAGRCELQQTLDDGRMLIHVLLSGRYRLVEEVQTLPFSIGRCERIDDEPVSEEERDAVAQAKEKVLKRLLAITAGSPRMQHVLLSPTWQSMDPVDFSFELFGVLRMEAELQQQILELTSPRARLEHVLALLNQHP